MKTTAAASARRRLALALVLVATFLLAHVVGAIVLGPLETACGLLWGGGDRSYVLDCVPEEQERGR
jgi:hypothetical protein